MAGKTSKKSAKAAKKAVDKAPHRAKSERRGARKRVAAKAAKPRKTAPKSQSRKVAKPVLLAGGNPQIAKADGDAPVQAYIAAMPGWKRDVGRRLDALIVRTAPEVRKTVKWNSPFYGIEGQGRFLNFHCFRSTSKWLSSAARHCILSSPASQSTRKCATSTSTRTTSSTRSSWRAGFGRHRSCPAGSRSATCSVRTGSRSTKLSGCCCHHDLLSFVCRPPDLKPFRVAV
jgi:hypothetical protein